MSTAGPAAPAPSPSTVLEMRAIDKSKIVYTIENGQLHQDGIPVKDWQLTNEELKKFFPEKYAAKFGDQPELCPLGCERTLTLTHKPGFINHMRMKHKEIYDAHKEVFADNDMKLIVERLKVIAAQ